MPASGFDELIHAPTRLAIVALLAATDWADFAFIRDSVGLSDSALSKQLTTLEEAGFHCYPTAAGIAGLLDLAGRSYPELGEARRKVAILAARVRFQCKLAPEPESRLAMSATGSGFSATRSSL